MPASVNSRRPKSKDGRERRCANGNRNRLVREIVAPIFRDESSAAVCVWAVVIVSVVLPPLATGRLVGEKLQAAYCGRSAHVKLMVPVAPGCGCCVSV